MCHAVQLRLENGTPAFELSAEMKNQVADKVLAMDSYEARALHDSNSDTIG